jgi:hypothetical protein
VTEQLVLDLVDTLDGQRLVDVVVPVVRRVRLGCGCDRLEAERPGGGAVHVLHGAHCEEPMRRHARIRLLRLATPEHPPGSVEKADQRTSLADARAALSLASGAHPDRIDPVGGQWDGFR